MARNALDPVSDWTGADLRAIGEAMYGERWQAPLAADIGVSVFWMVRALREPAEAIVRKSHEAAARKALRARRALLERVVKKYG